VAIRVRRETPGDIRDIYNINLQAFGREDEGRRGIIRRSMKCEGGMGWIGGSTHIVWHTMCAHKRRYWNPSVLPVMIRISALGASSRVKPGTGQPRMTKIKKRQRQIIFLLFLDEKKQKSHT